MELKNYFAQDAEGNAQPNATCYLYNADTTNLANGLVDADNQPLTNPFISNDYGLIQFKAPNGLYDLRVISGVRDYKIRVQAADASELIGGIADAVAAAEVATDAADIAQTKADLASTAATSATNARDASEAYAINVLSSVTAVDQDRIAAQQAALDAGNAAEVKVDVLRQSLINTSSPGAAIVSALQLGDAAVSRFIQDKLLEQAVSVDDFKQTAEGSNIRPALLRLIEAIRTNKTKSRVILIPYTIGEWTVDQQVLFNVSDITVLLYGNVRLTSTTRQKTFLFASDTTGVPATPLKNVNVYGNGSYVNGNATAMTFSYAHGDGSDNDSAIRFSYIDNLFVQGVWADNGPIDSFSTMRCRNQRIVQCKFTRAKEDNGFSATTDFGPTWTYGDFDTYSYGVVVDCVAEDNQDFGMTAFNCSGVYFINGRSQRNRAGYSYEDSFGSPDVKKYDGGFFGCWAWACKEQGFYIDAEGIGTDQFCKAWNIRYIGSNPNGLFGNGVVVANVTNAKIDGEFTGCGNAGMAIFNGTGNLIDVHASGKFNGNDGAGILARGVNELVVAPGTEIKGNGKTLVNSAYNYGINASNSGGSTYLQGLGTLKVSHAIISGNGLGAIDVNYLKTVDIQGVLGIDNAQSASALGIRVQNATIAKIFNNHIESATGNQTFAIDIEASVANGYEGLNTGTGTTGIVANNAVTRRQSVRSQYYTSVVYDAPSIAAGSQVAPTFTVLGAEQGDFVQVSFSTDIGLINYYAYVSTTDNVTVYFRNGTGSAIDLPSLTVRLLVTKRNGG